MGKDRVAPEGRNLRALLLDYGGTLVEEIPTDADSMLLELFTLHGLSHASPRVEKPPGFSRAYWKEHYSTIPRGSRWTDDVRTECNLTLIRHHGLTGDAARVAREVAERDEMQRGRPLYPDVLPALEALSSMDLTMGVVSQSLLTSEELSEELARRGIGRYFRLVLTSESTGLDKPDPRIYLEAVSRLGLSPGKVAHVGDSLERDARAAQAAGLRGILLHREGTPPTLEGMEVIRSLEELPVLLSRRTARRGEAWSREDLVPLRL